MTHPDTQKPPNLIATSQQTTGEISEDAQRIAERIVGIEDEGQRFDALSAVMGVARATQHRIQNDQFRKTGKGRFTRSLS